MLTLLVGILLAVFFFRLLGLAIKGVGGLLLILGGLILIPLIVIGLLALGLAVVALPIIIIVGIISLVVKAAA